MGINKNKKEFQRMAKEWFIKLQKLICKSVEEVEKEYGSNAKFKKHKWNPFPFTLTSVIYFHTMYVEFAGLIIGLLVHLYLLKSFDIFLLVSPHGILLFLPSSLPQIYLSAIP